MKIVYITPHLSTGGMPEYLRKKVELLHKDNQVWVLEMSHEPRHTIIRDKIESLIGENLVKLDQNYNKLLGWVEKISPDVLHFEEPPDYFIPEKVLDIIYAPSRTWKIFETLHDSSIDWREKRFIPDKMLVVSLWQSKNFLPLGVPVEIIEYEVSTGNRNRERGLQLLGLDPEKKHVLQVGIFSRRKNQKWTFELAKHLPEVQFHFVGGTSENYRDYWQELLDNKPENCVVWGERSDVQLFYSCVDAVVFPSEGSYGDTETNPLAIKEAIAWKIPLFLRNIGVYMNMYPQNEGLKFITNNLETDKKILQTMIGIDPQFTIIKQDFFKQKLFDIKFDPSDNKVSIFYLKEEPFDMIVCIRDIDSQIPIYSFSATFANKNDYWAMPLPKNYYDFIREQNFRGFLVDFYDPGRNLLYSQELPIKDVKPFKKKFRIDTFEPIFINYEQFFTDKIYDSFLDNLGELDLVLDVGSSCGLFTQLIKERGFGKLYAFEVSPKATEVFNQIHGRDDRIELINKAVWSGEGKIKIYEDPENSIVSSAVMTTSNYFEIESISLDSFFRDNNIQKVGLMKMDIEAGEYKAFEGLSDQSLSKIENLILEFHENFGGVLWDKILRRLDNLGYNYQIFKEDCKNPANLQKDDKGVVFASLGGEIKTENSEEFKRYPIDDDFISVILDRLSETRSFSEQVSYTKNEQHQKTIVIIDCYISSNRVRGRLIDQIKRFKLAGFDVMLVSNTKVDEEVQGLVDFFFYDKRNQLFEHDYQDIQEIVMNDYVHVGQEHLFTLKEQVKGSQKHGLSVIINTHNSVWLAKSLGYENFIRCEVDDLFSNDSINWMKNTENLVSKESKKSLLFFNDYPNAPSNISFHFMFWNIDFFLQTVPKINNEKEYQDLVGTVCKERDFLTVEELYYRLVINKTDDILVYKGEDMVKLMPRAAKKTEFSLSNLVDKFNEFFYRVYRIEGKPGFFLFTRNLTTKTVEVRWEITYNSGKTDTIIQKLPEEDSWAWNIVGEDLISWKIYVGQEFVSSGFSSQILNVGIDKSLGQLSKGQINWVEFVK